MIPLPDDILQSLIAEKLRWLKEHPAAIDIIFRTGRRSTLLKLRDFIVNRKIKVIIGYPKEQTSLPAYVITLAPEQEQPMGLGDDSDSFRGWGIGEYDTGDGDPEALGEIEDVLSRYMAGTFMNSNYRIECWSDNGDLTSYMYVILKWCLWSSRKQMIRLGWNNVTVSGTDLEPVPDYMPFFIYRRAAQISFLYNNLYYEDIKDLGVMVNSLERHPRYDADGNILDEDGNLILPAELGFIVNLHWILDSEVEPDTVKYSFDAQHLPYVDEEGTLIDE